MQFSQNLITLGLRHLALAAWCLLPASQAFGQTPAAIADIRFAELPLKATLGSTTVVDLQNDRGIVLGGFSDLSRRNGDSPGVFWIVTDRGPNGKVKIDGEKRRTFPVPDYAPAILKVKIDDGTLTLVEALPLVGRSGKPIGGLPNSVDHDGKAFDFTGKHEIAVNPNGVDTEGLACAPDGGFWVAEEYGPSLLKIDATGKVVRRLVPRGTNLTDADYDVVDSLPAIYSTRQDNRGFEGLALSPDGTWLFAAMQSALANPTEKAGKQSRHVRILCIDTRPEKPVAEYVYQFDVASEFDSGAKPDDMKIGALAAIDAHRLLVLERVDRTAKLYVSDISNATNVLNSPCHDDRKERAIETIDLAAYGIRPLAKSAVADLSGVPNIPHKLEGMAILDPQTIAIVNDNDFGFSDFDQTGRAIPSGAVSRLLLLRLAEPVK